MEKRTRESVQVQQGMTYEAARETGKGSQGKSLQQMMQNVHVAVLGLVIMTGWICLAMKSSEQMFRQALPAYLLICCLIFFKATEQKS